MAVESSLRERQKTRRRADILAAGKSLFSRRGYSTTSMQAIAQASEVGIATVYNYFGTKGSLLAEILRADFDLLFERGEAMLAQKPGDLDKGVLELIELYQQFQDHWEPRHMLVAVMGPGLSAEPELGELARDAESRVMSQLVALLSLYQRAGKVRADIDINDAALIIFYIFNQHFIEYVSQETVEFSAMKAAMDRQIRFIVSAIRQG
ncbi:MAG TPA: TetR/AcrR family transcriptional regulator [Xanthomonadales bacterium]|nr:TetR/AcrR family transcriptional regulator [Xanthomonadales bacterium]